MRTLINHKTVPFYKGAHSSREPAEFHRRLPESAPTPLRKMTSLAHKYNLKEIYLKDESRRLGLPAFKILGASWAVWKILESEFGLKLTDWENIEQLRARIQPHLPLRLLSASDGNHGHGVARMSSLLGIEARIFLPAGTVPARIEAIAAEGAEVVVVDGSYDDAVAQAAAQQGEKSILIQDTSWEGYETVNHWIIEGYSTLFWEIEDELNRAGLPQPDIVFVQIGVGSLAAAAVNHFRNKDASSNPRIVGVEPLSAACAMDAVEAGEVITLPAPQNSIMAGLNCGTLATAAYPMVEQGIDCFLALEDHYSREAMRILAAQGIPASESGVAGLAGLLALFESPEAEPARKHLKLSPESHILLLLTEGVTDPAAYSEIVHS